MEQSEPNLAQAPGGTGIPLAICRGQANGQFTFDVVWSGSVCGGMMLVAFIEPRLFPLIVVRENL